MEWWSKKKNIKKYVLDLWKTNGKGHHCAFGRGKWERMIGISQLEFFILFNWIIKEIYNIIIWEQ